MGIVSLNQDGTTKVDEHGNTILAYSNDDILSFSKFPKTDTLGGYVGDHYPLCQDLPDSLFLKEGATYRLLGASNLPELMSDPQKFATELNVKRAVLDSESHFQIGTL